MARFRIKRSLTRAANFRRQEILQEAADKLAPDEYARYFRLWHQDSDACEVMERDGILKHLRASIDQVIDEVQDTRVASGVCLWHVYNMGYVIKSPKACVGIDLHGRGVEQLATALDCLLASHAHIDHFDPRLVAEMTRLNKPIISRDLPSTFCPPNGTCMRLAGCEIQVFFGDHRAGDPTQTNDLLIFQLRLEKRLILHASDNSNLAKTPATRPDLFIFHVSNNLPVRKAIERLQPAICLPSHILELSHSPHAPRAWRHSFERARTVVDFLEPSRAPILTWGESVLLPGTRLVRQSRLPSDGNRDRGRGRPKGR